jgi:hypothetical protein
VAMYSTANATLNLSEAGREVSRLYNLTRTQSESQESCVNSEDSQKSQVSLDSLWGYTGSQSQDSPTSMLGDNKGFARQFSTSKSLSQNSSRSSGSNSSPISTSTSVSNRRSFLQNFAHKSVTKNAASKSSTPSVTVCKRTRVSSGSKETCSKVFKNIKFNRSDEEDEEETMQEEEYTLTKGDESSTMDQDDDDELEIVYDDELTDEDNFFKNECAVGVTVDWEEIKLKLREGLDVKLEEGKTYARTFREKIAPGERENKRAEEELTRQLSKDMFSKV